MVNNLLTNGSFGLGAIYSYKLDTNYSTDNQPLLRLCLLQWQYFANEQHNKRIGNQSRIMKDISLEYVCIVLTSAICYALRCSKTSDINSTFNHQFRNYIVKFALYMNMLT